MSALRPDTIRPSAYVQVHRVDEVEVWRHLRSRRLYFAEHARRSAHAVIATRVGGRMRVVSREQLHRDFVRVVACRCGGHHRPGRVHER